MTDSEATEPESVADDLEPEAVSPEDAASESETVEGTEPAEAADESVESLIADLERVTAERDQYQRVAAEYANFRKQAEKRQSEMAGQAGAAIAGQMLNVLDACDAAILQGADAVAPIHASLLDALNKAGLEPVDSADVAFDPNEHEAVQREEGDGSGDQIVTEVLRTGYRFNGKLLRAAMVKVRG